MLMSNWLNSVLSRIQRRPHYNSRARRAMRKRWQAVQHSQLTTVDSLEERLMLTTTIFLDFGQGFINGELNTTVNEFATIDIDNNNGVGINGYGTGANLTGIGPSGEGTNPTDRLQSNDDLKFQPLSYDFDGDSDIDNDDLTALSSQVLSIIEQSLEAFDIDIQIVSASNFSDVRNTLNTNNGDATGEHDAYVFITEVTSQRFGGAAVGNSAEISNGSLLFGVAAADDLIKTNSNGEYQQGNFQDEAALVFADTALGATSGTQGTAEFNENLAHRLAYTATHEAFHTFSYFHTTSPLANGDIIPQGSTVREEPFIVTRFDLNERQEIDNVYQTVSEPNNYLQAANDPDIGLSDDDGDGIPNIAYITGTGGHDIITLTSGLNNTVNVTVRAFADSAKTSIYVNNDPAVTLATIETYTIDLSSDTEGEILIDASINDDDIIIDSSINASIRIRGGSGNDVIHFIGDSPTGNPSRTYTIDGEGGNDVITVHDPLILDSIQLTAETINLNGSTITTTGDQTYNGAVTLGLDTTLNGKNVTFNGTVDTNDDSFTNYQYFNNVSYQWEDISASGTALGLSLTNLTGESGAINLGFDFNFYGNVYSDLFINAHGFATFTPGQSYAINASPPIIGGTDLPNNLIAGYWSVYDPGAGGEIYVETRVNSSGEKYFLIQFDNVPHFTNPEFNNAAPVSFQMKLFENSNNIEIHFKETPGNSPSTGGNGFGHRVGIENADGTNAFQSHGTYQLGLSDHAIRFTPDYPQPNANLTINTSNSGTTTFNGNVGGSTGIGSITTNNDGTTELNADINVNLGHTLVFNDAVTLISDVTISAPQTNFHSTLDGASNLTFDSSTAAVTFHGAVGANTAIGSGTGTALTINSGSVNVSSTLNTSSGIMVSESVSDITFGGDVNIAAGDTGSFLNGSAIRFNNATFASAGFVSLGSDNNDIIESVNSGAIKLAPGMGAYFYVYGRISDVGTNSGGTEDLIQSGLGTVMLRAINDFGSVDINNGKLLLGINDAFSDASSVTVNGGTFDLGVYSDTVNNVTLQSGVITGSSGVLTSLSDYVVQAGTVTVVLGGTVGLTKNTTGTVTLSSDPTYTGTTTINTGTLIVESTISSGVTVNTGGILGGSGTITGTTSVAGGTLAPGSGPGIFDSADVSFNSSSQFTVDINGQYSWQIDQLRVTGAIDLGGAALNVALNGFVPNDTQSFILIDNDSTDPITGTFNGLFEGDDVVFDNTTFRISYLGGDGNDVVLTPNTSDPTVVSISTVGSSITNAASVKFRISFSEEVIGFQENYSNHLVLNSSANLSNTAITDITKINDLTYDIDVSTGQITGVDPGTIWLDLVDNDTITDIFGNLLGGAGAGNGSFTTGDVFTIDFIAPDAPVISGLNNDNGISNSDGVLDNNRPIFYGTAEPGSRVRVWRASNSIATVIADAQGNWVATAKLHSLNAGNYTLYATAEDAAGNVSVNSASFAIEIDLEGDIPLFTGLSIGDSGVQDDQITNEETFTIHGTAESHSEIKIYGNDILLDTILLDASGSWSLQYMATEGDKDYVFTAMVTDQFGHESAMSPEFTITLDNTSETPVMIGINDDTGIDGTNNITRDQELTLYGTAEANSTVTVYRTDLGSDQNLGTTIADASGNWTYDYNQVLAAGTSASPETYTFKATVIDAAGNPESGFSNVLSVDIVNDSEEDAEVRVDLRVVTNQTSTIGNDEAVSLPDSEQFLNEWGSYWVEIWLSTPYTFDAGTPGIKTADIDLEYFTDFTSATEVEFGSAFTIDQSSTIDDTAVAGTTKAITKIKASTASTGLGASQHVLFARVKFEATSNDQVNLEIVEYTDAEAIANGKVTRSLVTADPGFDVAINEIKNDSDRQLTLNNGAHVGELPTTEILPNLYDYNDNDRVDFRDLTIFASSYGKPVVDTIDSNGDLNDRVDTFWLMDYDQSGEVNFRDLVNLAAVYGGSKSEMSYQSFPGNFPDAWFNSESVIVTPESSLMVTGTTVNEDTNSITVEVTNTKQLSTSLSIDVETTGSPLGYAGSDSATDGTDFDTFTGTLNFSGTAGEKQYINIPLNDDNIVELDEIIYVNLDNLQYAGLGHIEYSNSEVLIGNDDEAQLSINDLLINENQGTATFTVTLNNDVDTSFTVDFATADNQSMADSDYVANSGTINFAGNAGETQTVTITINDDSLAELDESFFVNLSNVQASGRNVTLADSQGVGTILDDDSPRLSMGDAVVDEDAGTATFTVTLDKTTASPLTIDYATTDHTAIAADDYVATSGTLNFAGTAGETQTIVVNINADSLVELDEAFFINLTNLQASELVVVGNSQATGTISNDDSAHLSINDIAVNESEGTATFTVTLDNDVNTSLSVDFVTADNNTEAGADYVANSGILNFTGNSGETQTVTITLNDDSVVEFDESFFVNLVNVQASGHNVTLSDSQAEATLTDNDNATLSIANVSVNENAGTATFTVTLDQAVQDGLSVDWSTADDTAIAGTDYTAGSGTLNFLGNAGETQTISVSLIDDNASEQIETFLLNLSNVQVPNTNISIANQGQAFIAGNDGGSTITINGSSSADHFQLQLNVDGVTLELWNDSTLVYGELLASITELNINGGAGDDTLTVNLSNGLPFPLGNINFNGEADGGSLVLDQDNYLGFFTNVTHTLSSETAGSVSIDGQIINYTSAASISDQLLTTNRIFDFVGTAETITLSDSGTNIDGLSSINSTLSAAVTFASTVATLTVSTNSGTGTDVINVQGLDSLNAGNLTITGDADDDVIFQTNNIEMGTNDVTVSAQTITVDSGITSTSGAISLTASRNMVFSDGSSLTTMDGGITLLANSSGTIAGEFTGIRSDNTAIETTGTGNISITGNGGNGSGINNYGLNLVTTDIVSSSTNVNAGTITINGTGGTGTQYTSGVRLKNSSITSIEGDVFLIGQGGNGTLSESDGVILGTSTINLTNANLDINAQAGGTSGSSTNYGFSMKNTASIISTGSGTISIDGTGGIGTNSNVGVKIASSNIDSDSGSISITGQGGTGTGTGNSGVYVDFGSIASTGTGIDAATITINGTGGAGTDGNTGILQTNASITSIYGDVSLIAQGGNGTGLANIGILIDSGSVVSSTGTGTDAATITIDGTGGTSSVFGIGIKIDKSTTKVTSVDGDISITGQGSSGAGGVHFGVNLSDAEISSTGTGPDAATITVYGTGGTGGGSNDGIAFTGVSGDADVTSVDGDISITSADNAAFSNSMSINSTSGNITILADAATGNNGKIIAIHDGTIINAGSGNIDLDTDGTIFLSGLSTTGHVTVDSTSGSILDHGDTNIDIIAGTASINAAGSIGTGANPLETQIGSYAASSGTNNGNINNRERFSISDVTANEDGSFVFTINLSRATNQNVTVLASTTFGSADAADFTSISNQLVTIVAGQTSATVTVNVSNDSLIEDNETFSVVLSDPKFNGVTNLSRVDIDDGTATGTILTDDFVKIIDDGDAGFSIAGPDWVHFIWNQYYQNDAYYILDGGSAADGSNTASWAFADLPAGTYRLSTHWNQGVDRADNVPYSVAGIVGGTVNGTFDMLTLNADVTDDGVDWEDLGYFEVAQDGTLTVSISDNLVNGTIYAQAMRIEKVDSFLSISDVAVDERAGTATFAVTSSLAVENPFSVDFATANGSALAGSDYTTTSGTLNFTGTAGEIQYITVPIINDNTYELLETFQVNLSNVQSPGENILIEDSQGQGTITGTDDLIVTIDGTTGADDFQLQLNADGITLELLNNSTLVYSGLIANISEVNVNGNAGIDTLTIDMSNGLPLLPVGINFDGEADGGSLILDPGSYAGSLTTITHTLSSNSAGSVSIDGQIINYTSAETLTDSLDVTNRVFDFVGAAETITLTDFGISNDGLSIIDSTLGAAITFVSTASAVTVSTNSGSGADAINIQGLDSLNASNLTVTGDADDDVTFQTNNTAMGANALSVTARMITLDSGLSSTSGAISLTASRNILLNSVSSLTTIDGGITLLANNGGITTGDFVGIEANNATIQTSGTGNISLTGFGRADSGIEDQYGVYLNSTTLLNSTSTGMITVNGTGGNGAFRNYGVFVSNTEISSEFGDISLTGQGGDGTAGSNRGIHIDNGSLISSSGTGANAAAINIDGTGGKSTNWGYGVNISDATTKVTSIDGDIVITGQGRNNETGEGYVGVVLNGSEISSTGLGINAATVLIDGTGGTGTVNNHGVFLANAALITSTDGAISLTGQGGNGTVTGNNGVIIDNSSSVSSVGSGTNAATITINGTGGSGTSDNYGVRLNNASVTSADGDILLTGQGGAGAGISNIGVFIDNSGLVSSTGTGPDAATITINGTAGTGTNNNHGVLLNSISITSIKGDISLVGQGGGSGTGTNNTGIYMVGPNISSTGFGANAASITLNGTGGNGTSNSFGMYLNSSTISSNDGGISLIGQGGDGTDINHVGVYMDFGTISSTGIGTDAAKITIDGTGGAGTNFNRGFLIYQADITSIDGDILITGVGAGGNASDENQNHGVNLHEANVTSTGTGVNAAKITIDGTGGTGLNSNVSTYLYYSDITSAAGDIAISGSGATTTGEHNYGVILHGGTVASTAVGTNAAKITIDGTGGAGTSLNHGVFVASDGVITTKDGDISITGNGNGNGIANLGVVNDGTISSTGIGTNAGKITIDGTGGAGTQLNRGIVVSSGSITSTDGNISLTGQGGGSINGLHNQGILLDQGTISSTGTGPDAAIISIHGTGGVGTASNDGFIGTTNSIISSVVTDISFVSDGNVWFYGDSRIESSSGDINATANYLNGNNTGVFYMNTGTVFNAGSGNIDLDANDNTYLTSLISLGTVTVDSTVGSILDNGDVRTDIHATTAILNALNSVGTSGNPLETSVVNLSGAGTNGGFHVNNSIYKHIIDDGDAGFSISGSDWVHFVWNQYYQNDAYYILTGGSAANGSNTASWAFSNLNAGRYRLTTTWNPGVDRADNVPFSVSGIVGGTANSTFDMNTLNPDVSDDGVNWESLGYFDVAQDGTLTVSISDNLVNGTIYAQAMRLEQVHSTLSVSDVSVNEDAGTATFTVTSSMATGAAFSVDYATANGTAIAGTDYTATSGTLNFTGTSGETQAITVTLNSDNTVELDENFLLNLSNIQSSGLLNIVLEDSQATGTITNDDTTVMSLASANVTQAEGDSGTTQFDFVVNISNPLDVDFHFWSRALDNTATEADGDFTDPHIGYWATIAAGATSTTVSYSVNGDTKIENDEVFNYAFPKANIYSSLSPLTILTDDYLNNISFAGSDPSTLWATGTITNDDFVKIIDNGDAGFSQTGSWFTYGGNPLFYQNDYSYVNGFGNGSKTSSWAFSDLPAGTYRISGTWYAHAIRATNIPVTISGVVGGNVATTINQELLVQDVFDDGVYWQDIGSYEVDGNGTITVTISDDQTNGNVLAEAFRLELINPLMAANGQSSSNAPAITQTDLNSVRDAALNYWESTGLTEAQLSLLESVDFVLYDLPDGMLGGATSTSILIDNNAAGYGWFVDTTPFDSSEFTLDTNGNLIANEGSAASGRMDLLTVVMHELGHTLGHDHEDEDELMGETLDLSERHLPEVDDFFMSLVEGENPLLN